MSEFAHHCATEGCPRPASLPSHQADGETLWQCGECTREESIRVTAAMLAAPNPAPTH